MLPFHCSSSSNVGLDGLIRTLQRYFSLMAPIDLVIFSFFLVHYLKIYIENNAISELELKVLVEWMCVCVCGCGWMGGWPPGNRAQRYGKRLKH